MNRRFSVPLVAALAVPVALGAFVLGLLVSQPHATLNAQSATSETAGPMIVVTPEGVSPFVGIADKVIPAVVNISTTTKPVSSPLDDFFRDLPFPFQVPSPQQRRGSNLGSGVVVDPDGYIVTNNHVVAEATDITVTMSDKTEFKGKSVEVVGADPVTDIALLKVKTDRKLPVIEWSDSDSVKVGEWAIAVGNPYGLSGTVTVGVVSAKGRSGIPLSEGPSVQDFIQTDASINPGNSGGPLVDIKGRIIGINSAIRSPVGANVGIGFAVPTNIARKVVNDLRTTGKISHGYLGIRPQEVTEAIKDAMGLDNTDGVVVGEVVDNTPARKAGLQVGDVIVRFDGRAITDVAQFRTLVAGQPAKKTVKIDLVRDGKKMSLSVELGEYPTSSTASTPGRSESWNGVTVGDLTASEKERTGAAEGAIIRSVEPGSAAERAGLAVNDVVTKITVRARGISAKVANRADFERVTGELKDYDKAIAIQIRRNSGTQIITLTPEK